MAGREITDLKEITTLFHQASEARVGISLKLGRFKKAEGLHSRLVRNAIQAYLPRELVKDRIDQEVEATTFFPPVTGKVTYQTSIAAVEANVSPPDGMKIDAETMAAYILTQPQSILLEDVRTFSRLKFSGVVPIKARIYRAHEMPDLKKGKKEGEEEDTEVRSFVTRVLDVSQGGLKALYPLSTESMHVLKDSQELELTFTMMGIPYRSGAEIIDIKENPKARKGLLRVIFKDMSEEDRKRLGRYIEHRLAEENEKNFKRIMEKQLTERKIINPRTLRDEMSGEELDNLMWRKKGDIYLVQVDKLTKGKKAFVIYLPKRGTKDMFVRKDWSEDQKK
ncbi:PilZ domain-containing protein [candidate division KSB1 bacterium]